MPRLALRLVSNHLIRLKPNGWRELVSVKWYIPKLGKWIHQCPAGTYTTDTLLGLVWTIFTHRLHHFLKGEGFKD